MSLASFVESARDRPVQITVVNRTEADPVMGMLEEQFGGAVEIREVETEADLPPDLVVSQVDGETVAVSTLGELRDQLLLVNSDLYITGTRSIEEIETPDVVTALSEVPFRLGGYQHHHSEKMLLIEMSRHVEARAAAAGAGTLHAGFQRLSRLDDERGTASVYRRLTAAGVDVHCFGAGDAGALEDLPATVHDRAVDEIRESWFVVYVHPDAPRRNAALVAVERGPNDWEGLWTYDADQVRAVASYLERSYGVGD